jgi:hypothetical protein
MTLTLQDNRGCPLRLHFPLQQWRGREWKDVEDREGGWIERNRRTDRERSSLSPGVEGRNVTKRISTIHCYQGSNAVPPFRWSTAGDDEWWLSLTNGTNCRVLVKCSGSLFCVTRPQNELLSSRFRWAVLCAAIVQGTKCILGHHSRKELRSELIRAMPSTIPCRILFSSPI